GTTNLLEDPLKLALTDKMELLLKLDASAVPAVNVSGRVEGLLTTPGVRVVLTNPVFGSVESSVKPDGSFAFSKIVAGVYIARLSLSGIQAAKQILVSDKDLTDVIITYPREFVVAGHILVEGDKAGALPEVVLDAKNSAGRSTISSIVNGGVTILNLK